MRFVYSDLQGARYHSGKKRLKRKLKFWALKVFIISLVLTAGISVVTELLLDNLSIVAAACIILFIVLVGVLFDIIGIAVITSYSIHYTKLYDSACSVYLLM